MKIFTSLLISFITGCIVWIPTPEHGYSHMKEVNEDMVKQLEPGTTTKEDIRLLIGDHPSMDWRDDFCYFWQRKDGYWFAAGGGDADAGSTEDENAFCLEFMPDGKLKRFKHFESGWFKKDVWDQIYDWEFEEN